MGMRFWSVVKISHWSKLSHRLGLYMIILDPYKGKL